MSKNSVLARVQEMTRQAREREAEKLLTLSLVKEAISEAAGQGYSRAVIAPTKPVDLTNTDVAKSTVAQLEKEGFRVEWEIRLQQDNSSFQAMIVTWI